MNIMIKYLICISVILFSLFSCDTSKDEFVENKQNYRVDVKVEYVQRSEYFPDIGSKIYIYFNCKQENFTGLQYDGEGVFSSEAKTIKPDTTYVVDFEGIASLDFEGYLGVEFCIVVESEKKKGIKGFLYIDQFDFKENDVLSFRFH